MESDFRHNVSRSACNLTALGQAGATVAKRSRSCIFGIVVLSLAGSCLPVPRGHNPFELRFMSTEELREYAEEVFREQNRLTTRLMMAPMGPGSITSQQRGRVEKAEVRMNNACASLNTIASARARGNDIDVELENRVRRDVRECARQTERLKALLDEFEIGTSRQKSSLEADQSTPDRLDSNQSLSMDHL